MTHIDGIPDKIRITWYTMDADEPALEGKYFPEKSKSTKKFLEDELCLSETTVYAYNFALLGSQALSAMTRQIIQAAMEDRQEIED